MKISTKGRYALRMMMDLAISASGECVSLRDVAERQGISMKYMEQIVSGLTKSGLLLSVRGPQGGYKLARKLSEYTVGDILRVTEGNLAPVACLETEVNECARADVCSTIAVWEGLYKVIENYVDNITLEDLAKRATDEKLTPPLCDI